jgi:hypothetical protein
VKKSQINLIGKWAAFATAVLALTACGSSQSSEGNTAIDVTDQKQTQAQIDANLARIEQELGTWKYVAETMSWDEAVENAPTGFRVPERWELVLAYDDRAFEGLREVEVWSKTTIDEDSYRARFTDLNGIFDSDTSLADQRLKYRTLYIVAD